MKDYGRKPYMSDKLTYGQFIRKITNKQVENEGIVFPRMEFKKPYTEKADNQQMIHYFDDPFWRYERNFDGEGYDYTTTPPPRSPYYGNRIEFPEEEVEGVDITETVYPVYVCGGSTYGCLGTGTDYVLREEQTGGAANSLTWMSVNEVWRIAPGDVEPGEDQQEITVDYLGGSLDYDYDRTEPEGDRYWWVYALDATSIPASLNYGTGVYTLTAYDPSGTGTITFTEAAEKRTVVYLDWPQYASYRGLSLPQRDYIWAHTDGKTSFLIDSSGKMYCAGSNHQGCLGIGQATGYTVVSLDGKLLPNYYLLDFQEVGGTDWMQVSGTGAGTADSYVWALKTDGSLWVCGAAGAGLGLAEGGYVDTFILASSDVWRAIIKGLGVLKDSGSGGYDLYVGTSGGLTLYTTISAEDWAAAFGSFTPEEVAASQEGFRTALDFDGDRTFIGAKAGDTDGKAAGTLWSKISGVLKREMPGTDWLFTTGMPTTESGVGPAIAIREITST